MTCSCALAAAADRCKTLPADVRLLQWQPERRIFCRIVTTLNGHDAWTQSIVVIPAPAPASPDTRPAPPSIEDGR